MHLSQTRFLKFLIKNFIYF